MNMYYVTELDGTTRFFDVSHDGLEDGAGLPERVGESGLLLIEAKAASISWRKPGDMRSSSSVDSCASSGGPLESEYSQWSAAIDLSWELDLWGKLAAGVDAAEAEIQAVMADLAAARLSVAAQVTIAWFGLREATQQVALSEATVATYERSLKAIEDRHSAGLTGTLDLRLSQANVAGSRAQLASAERAREAGESLRGASLSAARLDQGGAARLRLAFGSELDLTLRHA